MKTHLFSGPCFMKAALLASLIFLMSTPLFAQSNVDTYTTSQTNSVSALCLGCSIENPQNVVGNNITDYSTLKMGTGLLGKVEQVLKFPTVSSQKLKIDMGTGNSGLSIALLSGATVETMNGNVSNGDSRAVNNNILTIDPGSPSHGTIEFRPAKPYDAVKISLNAGLLGLNRELRIYYAKQSVFSTSCATLAADPFLYYSFDGNLNESIQNKNLTIHEVSTTPAFQDGLACNKSLTTHDQSRLYLTSPDFPTQSQQYYEKTISFEAMINGELDLHALGTKISVAPNGIDIAQLDTDEPLRILYTHHIHQYPAHYTITILPKFRTAAEVLICKLSESAEYCSLPTNTTLSLYLNGDFAESQVTHYKEVRSNPDPQITLNIKNNLQIKDLIIYNKALSASAIKEMACSYNIIPNCTSGTPAPPVTVMKATPVEELFTVSPNPTTGQITLDGNILLLDASISIRNTSGREVYQSPFRTKTFDLPATLPGGVYFLTLQTKDKKVYTRKIILTR